jgi:hypothetical protein
LISFAHTGQEIKIACNEGFVKKDETEVVKCVTKGEYDPASPQGCKGQFSRVV